MKKKLDVQMRVKLRILKKICKLKNSLIVEETGDVAPPSKCCGKLTFDSEVDALAAISGGKFKNKTHKPIRAYRCEAGKWHLTSATKKSHNKMLDSIKKQKNEK